MRLCAVQRLRARIDAPVLLAAVLIGSLPVLLGAGREASADDVVRYAPVPPAIAAVIADAEEQALANLALGLLRQADQPGTTAPRLDWPRALLVMLGDVGLRAAAEQLATGNPSDLVKLYLLSVVAAAEHPDADLLLERAAQEPLPSLRMVAAQGLGLGRTAAAVMALERLARDPRAGVRAAALRALFAIDTPQARAARIELPTDLEPLLQTERLHRHRQVGDAAPALRDLALTAYRDGRRATLRIEAARLLAQPALAAPIDTLDRIALEFGTDVLGALFVRFGLNVPQSGYAELEVETRRAAIEAELTLLGRADAGAAARGRALARAVSNVASPVQMDPYRRDPIPEDLLRRRLPDIGPALVEPVVRRLLAGKFYLPHHGVELLRDLGPEVALPVFETLLMNPALKDLHGDVSLAMSVWGRIGGEAAADRLLAAPLAPETKLELVEALRSEPASWAMPLLHRLMSDPDAATRRRTRLTLKRRPEPEARRWLAKDVFERGNGVGHRLPPLLRPVDAFAWAVLARALEDPRYIFRHEALAQLAKPAFRSPRGRALLARYAETRLKPDIKTRPLQDYLYALVNQDPMEAVRHVREHWAELPEPKNSLRQLQEVWGGAPVRAAMDLALSIAAGTQDPGFLTSAADVLSGHASHRTNDVGAFWRRLLTWPDDDVQTSALLNIDYPGCADLTDLLLPMLDRARRRKGLEGTAPEADEAARAEQVLSALAVQSWPKVESAVVGTVLDPVAHPEVRVHAAHLCVGRARPAARARLLTWLAGGSAAPEAAPRKGGGGATGASAEGLLQFAVAQAVGSGGDAAVAGRIYRALTTELQAFYAVRLRLDPQNPRSTAFDQRMLALATGIAMTGHAPSIQALTARLFSPYYSEYAVRAMRLQSRGTYQGGPAAGARRVGPLPTLLHADEDAIGVLAPDAASLLRALRLVSDAVLAPALRATLEAARRSGALATFPDLYLDRIVQVLADGHDGPGRRKSASTVAHYADRLLPVRGPADLDLGRQSVAMLTDAGRIAEAERIQRRVLQILAQRGYDDEHGLLWAHERARLDLLEARRLVVTEAPALARDAFRRARMRAPGDPWTLMACAVSRAAAGVDLESAEADARRAIALHARARHEPTLRFVDQLARVLLAAGKPQEAIQWLAPRLESRARVETGRYFLHLALAYLAAGDEPLAREALVDALYHEPGLEPDVLDNASFAAWRASGRLQELIREAAARRRE